MNRRSIRLQGYDYTLAGAYFVTIATWQREQIFGAVVGDEMRPNDIGEIVKEEWERTEQIRKDITLDAFVVMPNHFHGILFIHEIEQNQSSVGAQRAAPLPKNAQRRPGVVAGSLGAIIRSFKSAATKRINQLRETPGLPVWQRNYYDHVIRDDKGLNRIRAYILDNPRRWADDQENPANWS